MFVVSSCNQEDAMQFLCLVYFEPGAFDALGPEESARLTDATIEHDHDLARRGHLIAARPLAAPETAVTVRVRKRRQKLMDGPFAEAKEVLGGFLLIEATDRDAAVALIAESPIAEYAVIEVRPLIEQTHSETGEARPAIRPGAGG
jgi:hypothetical protein